MKKTLYIKAEEFKNWYFDDIQQLYEIIDNIFEGSKIEANDFLRLVGYLPLRLIINKEDINKEDIIEEEIEEPNLNYELKLKF